jgi:hypothetical protein
MAGLTSQVSVSLTLLTAHQRARNIPPAVDDANDFHVSAALPIEGHIGPQSPGSHARAEPAAQSTHAREIGESFERLTQASNKRERDPLACGGCDVI